MGSSSSHAVTDDSFRVSENGNGSESTEYQAEETDVRLSKEIAKCGSNTVCVMFRPPVVRQNPIH
jgi:hypothetical protein